MSMSSGMSWRSLISTMLCGATWQSWSPCGASSTCAPKHRRHSRVHGDAAHAVHVAKRNHTVDVDGPGHLYLRGRAQTVQDRIRPVAGHRAKPCRRTQRPACGLTKSDPPSPRWHRASNGTRTVRKALMWFIASSVSLSKTAWQKSASNSPGGPRTTTGEPDVAHDGAHWGRCSEGPFPKACRFSSAISKSTSIPKSSILVCGCKLHTFSPKCVTQRMWHGNHEGGNQNGDLLKVIGRTGKSVRISFCGKSLKGPHLTS
jgi:hypothetical protein